MVFHKKTYFILLLSTQYPNGLIMLNKATLTKFRFLVTWNYRQMKYAFPYIDKQTNLQ